MDKNQRDNMTATALPYWVLAATHGALLSSTLLLSYMVTLRLTDSIQNEQRSPFKHWWGDEC